MVVQEASPSPVYGAALLMRLGFAPFRGSNPRASATDLGVRTSDTGSQSCSSDHLRHLVAHWWHERLRTALAGGRRRGLAGHRVGAEMTFQVIGSVRCRPAGRPLVEASEVSWSGFVPDLLSTFAASVLAIPGGLFLDRTQHLLLATSLYEDPSAGLHEDASARLREHPALLGCSILRRPSPPSSVGGHQHPAGGHEKGAVAITESDRTLRVAAPGQPPPCRFGTAPFRADNEIEWAQIAPLFAPCGLGWHLFAPCGLGWHPR